MELITLRLLLSKKTTVLACVAAASLLLAGCASTQNGGKTSMAPGQPPAKDRVLYAYRDSLSALRQGNIAEAERLLDDALTTIGGIYGTDKSAKKARGYFSGEEKKTFIGEPYERVMAYYYRGIIYWMNGEPDNARACFRSAQLQDADSETREYQNDWVLMDYLDGLASVKLSGDGADSKKRADESFKLGTLPDYSKKANTLVFLEFGEGPAKYATGEYNEELRIREGRSIVRGAWLKVDNKAVRVAPYDDLNYQATTRGGRIMDHILANKAVFKSSTDTFGNVGIIGGAVLASNRGTQEAGLGLLAAGVLSKVVSAATTPRADTRYWNNLPGYISFAALELPPGPHTATVEFVDGAGNVIPSYTRTLQFSVSSEGSDTVLFVSDKKS
jgi:hypothetical protein